MGSIHGSSPGSLSQIDAVAVSTPPFQPLPVLCDKRSTVGDRLRNLCKEWGVFGKDKDHVSTLEASESRQLALASGSNLNARRSASEKTSPSPSSSFNRRQNESADPVDENVSLTQYSEATTLPREIQHLVDSIPSSITPLSPALQASSPSPPPQNLSSNIYPNQLSNESSPSIILSDTSSVMVYSPLFPTQSDLVELAELAPFDPESGVGEERDADRDIGTFSSGNVNGSAVEQRSLESLASPQVGTNNTGPLATRTVKSQSSIRAWVPSPSKISVQAFWWGYRLYLPPPILEILSDKSLEAAKRSAVITTALTWFFNNLPVDVFPPPLRPGLVLLQRLVPVLGYIGTFISWSWGMIRSYDVGHGVTLTATWILPVALIPGTWYERDFPKSPMPNSPIPLPLSRPLSIQSFDPSTPMMSMSDDDIATSAYATPMSSVLLRSPLVPHDAENTVVGPSLASSSTAWSASPPPHLPISPIYYPSTILPNGHRVTPDSPTSVITHRYVQPRPLVPTLPVPFAPNPATTLPSPRIRTPRFSTRMRSPSVSSNSAIPPHLTIHNPSPSPGTSTPTSTPIPMPLTPISLPPIPPDLPFSPKLVNQLLLGPVLQTVPLPDVDDVGDGGVGGVGVGVGVGFDRNLGFGMVDGTRSSSFKRKGFRMENYNHRGMRSPS